MRVFFFGIIFASFFLTGCEKYTGPDYSDDGLAPAVPGNLKIYYAGDGEASFVWSRNKEIDLQGYFIYKKVNGSFVVSDTVYENYFFDSGLRYDSSYYYCVSAVDSKGRESRTSPPLKVDAPNNYPPSRPSNIITTGRNWNNKKSVLLQWQTAGDYDIKDFLIYRDTVSGFTPDASKLAGTSSNTFFTDTSDITTGKNYRYKIISRDLGGLQSNVSSESSDKVLDTPVILSPADSSDLPGGTALRFSVLPAGTLFNITLYSTPFGNEVWSSERRTSGGSTEYSYLPEYLLTPGSFYYWRINTYTVSSVPNSISSLSSFRYLR